MNPEKEPSLKQREMLTAYRQDKRDLDWPTLDCAMSLLKLGVITITKVFPKAPSNSPRGCA